MVIQWYPGHMEKARREMMEKLRVVDFIMELVDARAPFSSRNPMLNEMIQDKTKITILMKKDLADDKTTNEWVRYFQSDNQLAISIDVNNKNDVSKVLETAKKISEANLAALQRKGIQNRTTRAMIIGIPNVGKSTLINRLANKKTAKIGARPGITKQQSWIKVGEKAFDLLDTPGILWPKFDDETVGYRLAAIGTIKDDILALEDIAAFVITYLEENYPGHIKNRYGIDVDMTDMWEVFTAIGKSRGALESGGRVNFDKVSDIVLGDVRSGKLGKISFESVK